jgi:hypothetical protein
MGIYFTLSIAHSLRNNLQSTRQTPVSKSEAKVHVYHQRKAFYVIYTLYTDPHFLPTAIMPKSCIICRAVASQDIVLQYCDQCQSALYCSKACQRIDWRQKQHRQICKCLNVGHGDLQLRTSTHTKLSIQIKETFEEHEHRLDEDGKRFFKLYQESTFEGSRAAALEMRKIAKRQAKYRQKFLLFHSLQFLIRSDTKMLSWPNSPLLVMLQFVDPNVLTGDVHIPLPEVEERVTPLHFVSNLADPFDYSTHENQLILAKQLIEHGANVNALSSPRRNTPLHDACSSGKVTNLDFVELLLEKGADPNAQDPLGITPLMYTIPSAPGAAKFLLNWSTTDANITMRSGSSFLTSVRALITEISDSIARPDNHMRVQHQFLLQQWRDIEEMLVERGAP